MKKKRNSFLRWRQGKKAVDDGISSPTHGVMANQTLLAANIVSPEKYSDDYSVYIVHEYVEGEITHGSKVAAATPESNLKCFYEGTQPCSTLLLEQVNSFIQTEVRSSTSHKNNRNSTVDNSLLDDDISTLRDYGEDDFVEDASFATRDVGDGCNIAKQRMIENITSVRCAHNTRGCEMKLRDDDSSYDVIVDADEWEREFGQRGCCFTQQVDGIVMETGKAVYDFVGEPEDYLFGERLVSAVRKCNQVE